MEALSGLDFLKRKMKNIYLDYNATSPMRPDVLTAMKPYFEEHFGNPSSFHQMGQKARVALENARKTILGVLGKKSGEIIFTSSATEANNLAILGIARKNKSKNHIISSQIEHLSVLNPVGFLKNNGFGISLAAPDGECVVSAQVVEKFLTPETGLVSLMAANNETGVLQPVQELKKNGFYLHVDAVQVFGKMKYDFANLNADFITVSAHKIGGPKGIGAVWIRDGIKIDPIIFGGHHEKNLRAGTENLPAIAGFAKAAEIAFRDLDKEEARISGLRDHLESEILAKIPDTFVNGSRKNRLPNTLNISFTGVETESMLMKLDSEGISASSGSACTSGSIDPSHVLQAMKLPQNRVRSAVRFSLGYGTEPADIDVLVKNLPKWVERLRA